MVALLVYDKNGTSIVLSLNFCHDIMVPWKFVIDVSGSEYGRIFVMVNVVTVRDFCLLPLKCLQYSFCSIAYIDMGIYRYMCAYFIYHLH